MWFGEKVTTGDMNGVNEYGTDILAVIHDREPAYCTPFLLLCISIPPATMHFHCTRLAFPSRYINRYL